MKKGKVGTILFIIILAILIGGYFLVAFLNNKTEEIYEGQLEEYTPQEEISEEQYRETIVNLYFLNKETGSLMAESRAIDAKTLVENPYKELVNLLIAKTNNEKLENILPEQLTVYDASIEGGCVTLNVSSEILNYIEDETLKNNMINSISKTLCELTEVNSVRFLIDGQENKKLADVYSNT